MRGETFSDVTLISASGGTPDHVLRLASTATGVNAWAGQRPNGREWIGRRRGPTQMSALAETDYNP